MIPAATAALRALRDVGAVSATWDHPGYRHLRHHRLVSYHALAGTDLAVHRLNDRGEEMARRLFQ